MDLMKNKDQRKQLATLQPYESQMKRLNAMFSSRANRFIKIYDRWAKMTEVKKGKDVLATQATLFKIRQLVSMGIQQMRGLDLTVTNSLFKS